MKSQLLVTCSAGLALLLALTACAAQPHDSTAPAQPTGPAASVATETTTDSTEQEAEEPEQDTAEPGTGTLVLDIDGSSYEMEGSCRYNADFDRENIGPAESFWTVQSANQDVYPKLSIIVGGSLKGNYSEIAFIYVTEEDGYVSAEDSVYTSGNPDKITGTAVYFWDESIQKPFTITCPD